jgi:hypothetical protein
MLLQSLRALCLATGGPGSIWKDSEAQLRTTGVSGGFAHDFETDYILLMLAVIETCVEVICSVRVFLFPAC